MQIGQFGGPETVGKGRLKMKKQFTGSFEYKGIEYDYTAVIFTGDDAYVYPDQITDLDRADRESINEGVWEEVEAFALEMAQVVEMREREGMSCTQI